MVGRRRVGEVVGYTGSRVVKSPPRRLSVRPPPGARLPASGSWFWARGELRLYRHVGRGWEGGEGGRGGGGLVGW